MDILSITISQQDKDFYLFISLSTTLLLAIYDHANFKLSQKAIITTVIMARKIGKSSTALNIQAHLRVKRQWGEQMTRHVQQVSPISKVIGWWWTWILEHGRKYDE